MSAPKVGDRVHVEFDGEVIELSDWPDSETVKVSYGGPYVAWIAKSACTVIVPPIAVGDVVTEANIGQIPEKSVIARDGYVPMHRRHDGRWVAFGSLLELTDRGLLANGDTDEPCRVLRIGGGS